MQDVTYRLWFRVKGLERQQCQLPGQSLGDDPKGEKVIVTLEAYGETRMTLELLPTKDGVIDPRALEMFTLGRQITGALEEYKPTHRWENGQLVPCH